MTACRKRFLLLKALFTFVLSDLAQADCEKSALGRFFYG